MIDGHNTHATASRVSVMDNLFNPEELMKYLGNTGGLSKEEEQETGHRTGEVDDYIINLL